MKVLLTQYADGWAWEIHRQAYGFTRTRWGAKREIRRALLELTMGSEVLCSSCLTTVGTELKGAKPPKR